MGYRVYYDEMWEIIDKIKSTNNNWLEDYNNVRKNIDTLVNSAYFRGDGAENVKLYLDEVHKIIIDQTINLFTTLEKRLEVYRGKYQKIDGGDGSDYGIRYTTMVEDEIKYRGEVSRNIDHMLDLNSAIKSEVNSVRGSISDLVSLAYPAFTDQIEDSLNNAKDIASKLDDKITEHESSQTSCFNDVDTVISELRSIINHQLSTSRIPMASYTQNQWSKMCDANRLEISSENIVMDINSLEADYQDSIANTFNRQDLIDKENKEKREKKAKIIKWAVTGVCVVASVAVTVATAGAAAPLVLGAVGAGTGAVTAATDFLLDEYVEDGNLKSVDWSGFGKNVVIGTATGFVTGYLGGTLSAGSTAGQTFLQKVGQGYATSIAEEVTEHTISTAWDVTDGILTGDIKDINGVLEEIESEQKELMGDIVKDGVSSIVDTALGDIVDLGEDKLFDDVKDGIGKSMGKVAYSSVTDVATDIIGDPTKNIFNEGVDALSEGRKYNMDNVTDKFKESIKIENIGKNLGESVLHNIEGEAKDLVEEKFIDKDKKFNAQMEREAGKDGKLDMIQFEDGTIVLEKDYEMAKYNAKNYTELDKDLGDKRTNNVREILGVKTTQGATKIQVDYDKVKKADYNGKSTVDKYVIDNTPKSKE